MSRIDPFGIVAPDRSEVVDGSSIISTLLRAFAFFAEDLFISYSSRKFISLFASTLRLGLFASLTATLSEFSV